MSHGNQQRAQLAAALVSGPDLVVLDEPFSGLDPVGVDALGDLMVEYGRRGAAVLFSSHQLDLVERFCRRVVIIDKGRVVLAGTLDQLSQRHGRHLRVAVTGAPEGWATTLPGVTHADYDARGAIVAVADSADPQEVLGHMQRLGPVTNFSFERPPLSVLFREAVEQ